MKKYVIIYTVAVLVAAGVASGASWHARVGPSMESTNPPFVISNRSLAPDLADPKIKLGLSSNVFVAKVLERIGDESDATQFRVKAILNIQGDVQGTGIVSQSTRGGDPLVQIGSAYLFATHYEPTTGRYFFATPETYLLMTNDANLSDADLKTLAEHDRDVIALQRAMTSTNNPDISVSPSSAPTHNPEPPEDLPVVTPLSGPITSPSSSTVKSTATPYPLPTHMPAATPAPTPEPTPFVSATSVSPSAAPSATPSSTSTHP